MLDCGVIVGHCVHLVAAWDRMGHLGAHLEHLAGCGRAFRLADYTANLEKIAAFHPEKTRLVIQLVIYFDRVARELERWD